MESKRSYLSMYGCFMNQRDEFRNYGIKHLKTHIVNCQALIAI